MGLSIAELVPKMELRFEDLNGKTLAIDAFNTLYQFLSTIRQPDGTPLQDANGNVTSHLSGLFYRNMSLLLQGIKLVYVFDGEPPALKGATHAIRKEARDEAREKYDAAKLAGDIAMMRKYSSSLARLNDAMLDESKELLEAMGVAIVQAPGEGEAEAAHLAKHSQYEIYASASQDYDSLLFGAPKLIQNLTLARKRKTVSGYIEIHPELVELEHVLNHLQINLDQLICLGILVGTDYNPGGIKGLGPKKALAFVKQYQQPVLIFEAVHERMLAQEKQFDWQEIFHLFKKPNVTEAKLNFSKFDESKIKEILCERHGFSEERLESQFEKMREFLKAKKQKGLKDWL